MSKAKILVADDSATIQKVFELAFESEDIEVVLTSDGKTALEKARELNPSLVIADVNMPEMNGFDLCREIKDDENISSIPVYLLSSSLDEFDEKRSIEAGAAGRFEKPFRSEEMVNQVKKVISSSSSEDETEINGDDTFDEPDIALDVIMDSLDLESEDENILAAENKFREAVESGDESDSMETLDLKAEDMLKEDLDEDEEFEVEVITGEEALHENHEELISEEDFEEGNSLDGAGADMETSSLIEDSVIEDIKTAAHIEISGVAKTDAAMETVEENSPDALDGEASDLVEETRRELEDLDQLGATDEDEADITSYIDPVEVESLDKINTSTEKLMERVLKEMEGGPFNDVLQEAVNNAIFEKITDDKMEPLIKKALEAAISDMKPQIIEMLRNVATELTLNMAEDMVQKTIDQIQSDY